MRDLTRQYRPGDWDSIIGQEALVKTLQNEIKNESIGHAYLFEGPRGTGKTTTARVFAKYIDAQVIELDGASNNGVENIRNLKDDVMYLPADGRKYKIYIIDEVHMLTTGAFNAFLKTLEEPPAHVIFILATTDPQKIPITVLSRCQRFSLKRIGIDDIVNRLQFIAEAEDINVDEDDPWGVLEYIARQVDGGLRDAIKLLQKCTSIDDVVTVQTVVDALGSVNVKHIELMVRNLLNRDIKSVILQFNELVREGIDIKIFLADIIEYLKESMTADIAEAKYAVESRMKIAEGLIELQSSLKNATQIKTVTELKLIRMCLDVEQTRSDPAPAAPTQTIEYMSSSTTPIIPDPDVLVTLTEQIHRHELRIGSIEMTFDNMRFKS